MTHRARYASLAIVCSIAAAVVLLIVVMFVLRTDDTRDTHSGRTATGMAPTISTGRVEVDTGSYLATTVTLGPGDAIRYRVEPGPALAAEAFVLTVRPTVRAIYELLWPFLPAHLRPDSIEEMVEGIGRDSRTALNPGAARSAFGDRDVIASAHPGLAGESEVGGGRTVADHLIALAPGEYTVLVQAVSGDDECRLIVEVAQRRIDTLQTYLADPATVLSHDPWFDEEAFFRDTAPWSPGGSRPEGPRRADAEP